jgi:predicted aldo/keto reductase-like oxidoreductase
VSPCPECGAARSERTLRLRGALRAAFLLAPFVAGVVVGAPLLHDLAEGNDRLRLPVWRLWLVLAVAALSVIGLLYRSRRPVCPSCGAGPLATPLATEPRADGATRRAVLRATGAATAVTVGGAAGFILPNRGWLPVVRDFFGTTVETESPAPDPAWKTSHIQSYRRLGRTNVMVSDISLGSGRIRDADVPRALFERGVTYVDTAPDYSDAGSERLLGEAMRGHRDKMFVATKFCRPTGHLPSETPVPEIIAEVEKSLQRLQTDHVDLIHVHSCDRVERLMAPNIHEAFDRLKEQGKVRFLGVSTHTPNLEEVANAAIDSGRFDVMMLAYHFGMWPTFGHILEKAKQHDVGVVAMKTLKGAKHTNLSEFRRESGAYSQSAFRWVLSNPNVSCLVISFSKPEHVDEYLAASGTALAPKDVARLEKYDRLIAGDYCQPHCGQCLDSCPQDLPINDVLRYRMYAKEYDWAAEGRSKYALLEHDASICVGCPAPCRGACPHGVPIRATMLDAHYVLRG